MSIDNSAGRFKIPEKFKVELTETEDRLCKLLDDCTNYLSREKGISTTCRIAGGWVRDKLLGSQCNDIDIALSNIMGLPFAEHLAAFAQMKGIETGTISKIAQNPDQSKHLETATLKIFGLDIDLVNLRSEEYTNESRIPTEVSFGTPLQDALRRDTTINALFYNIHTRSVEDFTEKGINDLQSGIIRTPLPPRETFIDDPLRVLRCIRFASRFNFELVPEIQETAKNPDIQNALISKVARERVGEEILKLMTGHDPLRAIKLIHCFSLYGPIFSVLPQAAKDAFSEQPTSADSALAAAVILHMLIRPARPNVPVVHSSLLKAVKGDSTCTSRLFLAAALTPYKGITYVDKKRKTQSAIELVIRESLKAGTQNHYLDGIPLLFSAARQLRTFVAAPKEFGNLSERVYLGLLLRNKSVHNANTGSHWSSSLLFSLVQDLIPCYDPITYDINVQTASLLIESYNSFAERIKSLSLADAVDAKPLLGGHEVVKVLGAGRSGPWVGRILSKIMEWQLGHPQGSKEACVEWLLKEQSSGKIHIEDAQSEPVTKRIRAK